MASVRSSSGAANYFAKDDHYTVEGSSKVSLWAGQGAASLGLSGEVGKEAFERILNGILPEGEKVGQVENRQSGMDITFSVPKSVSVMAYIAGDKRILPANLDAVRATMAWVEKNLAEGRKDVDGRKVPFRTGNLVYALFQHDTSRALDPQGHVHAVVANLTRMANGKWQALHNGGIWRNNSVIGSIYHAHLRDQLEKLGYQVELKGKHGAFEIMGVPKKVIDAFSQRREQILTRAAELGIASKQGLRDITTRTRDHKLNVDDRAALQKDWIEKAAGLGFTGKEVLAAAMAKTQVMQSGAALERGYRAVVEAIAGARDRLGALIHPHDPLVDHGLVRLTQSPADARTQLAVASAVRILSEREAAFPLAQLTKTALDLGLTSVTSDSVERRVGQLIKQGQLIPEAVKRDDGTIRMVTTRDALRSEESILQEVEKGRGTARSIVTATEAPDRLRAAANRDLNVGQMGAAALILSSEDRTVVIQGIAGAGKSTMLQAVARVAEAEGRRVTGLAFQNKMVADLADGAGIAAQTIASFVLANERHVNRQEGPSFDAARAQFAASMLMVDETSMVSSADMLKLHHISAALGVDKLVLVGDRQQLSSIDAGKAFAMIQAGGGTMARMDQNIRQNTDTLVAVAALANVGRAGQAMTLLGDHVVEASAPAVHAADLWLGLTEPDRAATAVFASGRSSRAIINQRIQEGLAAEGSLTGQGIHLTVFEQVNLTREELRYASNYRIGQTLEVGRGGAQDIGLSAGRYDVAKVGRRVELRDAAGRRFRFDPQQLSPTQKRGSLQLAEKKEIHLREGDRIRWTANDKARGIHNAGLARIIGISDAGVRAEMGGRDQLLLKPTDPMLTRLDLAYALNMHMAQGITTDKAITVMSSDERNLANQRLFNVGVTRVRDELTLVVDDKEKLQRQLDMNPGNKTSALEAVGRLDIDPDRKQGRGSSGTSQTPPAQSGLPDASKRSEGPAVGSEASKGAGELSADRKPGRLDALPQLPERSLGLDL